MSTMEEIDKEMKLLTLQNEIRIKTHSTNLKISTSEKYSMKITFQIFREINMRNIRQKIVTTACHCFAIKKLAKLS